MKKLIALLLAIPFLAGWPGSGAPAAAQPSPACDQASLSQVPGAPPAPPPAGQAPGSIPLKLAYHAIFPRGSLNCFMDRIHATPQALEKGDGQVPGQGATFTGATQGLVLGLTTPSPIPPIPGSPTGDTQTPSVGLFSTGLRYGPGAFFAVRSTFVGPKGPLGGKSWAASVNARTGNKNDLGTETRLNVTVRFKNGGATLNVLEAGEPRGSQTLPPSVYNAIVSTTSPQPFTLELLVNRITGKGMASLTSGTAAPQQLAFSLSTFAKKSGPVIEAVGPALANCCVPGVTVQVEVTDFQIWALPRALPHS